MDEQHRGALVPDGALPSPAGGSALVDSATLPHEEQVRLVAEMRAFVGPNFGYYVARWAPVLLGRRRMAGFNPGAFIFGAFWFAYRKMWLMLLLWYIAIAGVGYLEDCVVYTIGYGREDVKVHSIAMLILLTISGIFGNRIYLWHARRKIGKVRRLNLPDEQRDQKLARLGGTSALAAIVPLLPLGIMVAVYLNT
jgi:hypothetical protein